MSFGKNAFIQLKGVVQDGTREYKFTCHLSKFEKDANSFTKTLSQHINSPKQFASELTKAITGVAASSSRNPRKRLAGNMNAATTFRCVLSISRLLCEIIIIH